MPAKTSKVAHSAVDVFTSRVVSRPVPIAQVNPPIRITGT